MIKRMFFLPRPYFLIILCLHFLLWTGCEYTSAPAPLKAVPSLTADHAAIVTAHPLASEVGTEIMRRGGNAIDATIAAQFALAVVCPRAGNIGGGGFMVYRSSGGKAESLDFREKAPAAAQRNMYLDSLGDPIPDKSLFGHLAVGVPGTVAGMEAAHQRYGKFPWDSLLLPAIHLAREGFAITTAEAERLNRYQEDFRRFNADTIPFIKETSWAAGDTLRQPSLAHTLQRIRLLGSEGFYQGETADYLLAEMQRGGGLISAQDLAAYQAIWRKPLTGRYKDYRVISMPPPSSGGVALLQTLEMIEGRLPENADFQSPAHIHLLVEAERRAYADRARHLGDSDFYPVPVDSLLDSLYLQGRMANFVRNQATESESILSREFRVSMESFETTHISTIDAQGNAVSLTTTLNSNYGSKVWVHGAGFFLNNEMDDFSAKPGVPNQFGLIGAEANAIAPGKRMLSSMSPTIIEKKGDLFLVLGTPGGSTIITSVLQVFLNVAEFSMPLDSAIAAGRFHHQWLPDEIMYEKRKFSPEVLDSLKIMGHQLSDRERIALVKAIHVLPDGRLHAVGDPRNPDDAGAGY